MNRLDHKAGARRPMACALALAAAAFASGASASSHREAPFITTQPKVDGTDFYMFRSYETGRSAFTTLIADYIPLQGPGAGPNYYTMDQDALYEIHIDKNGDGVEDLTFQFRFQNTLKDITLPIGSKNVSIPLVQAGGIAGLNPANLNVRETYTVTMVSGDRRTGARSSVTNAADGSATFEKPVDNIGDKTFGSTTGYATYANAHIYNINVPGCTTPGRVFVGQRKDPFALALGQIFDLINLNPLGPTTGNKDALASANVTSLVLELPTACIVGTRPGDRRLDDREHAAGPAAVREPGLGLLERPEAGRRVGAGVAPRHAARQRGGHRPEGQGQVQQLEAERRRRSSPTT